MMGKRLDKTQQPPSDQTNQKKTADACISDSEENGN